MAAWRGKNTTLHATVAYRSGCLAAPARVKGETFLLPHSRPMPVIGKKCHELRIPDKDRTWRIVYRTDADAIVIAGVFEKKTRQAPRQVIETCKRRLSAYDKIL